MLGAQFLFWKIGARWSVTIHLNYGFVFWGSELPISFDADSRLPTFTTDSLLEFPFSYSSRILAETHSPFALIPPLPHQRVVDTPALLIVYPNPLHPNGHYQWTETRDRTEDSHAVIIRYQLVPLCRWLKVCWWLSSTLDLNARGLGW